MEFHEIDSKGKLWIERVATLPTWTASDIGRLVYAIDEDNFYKGGATEWQTFGQSLTIWNGAVFTPTHFEYASTTSITLTPGRYHLNGASERVIQWNSALTFVFGPAGSNANSSAIGTSQWQYLYIDDSSLSADTITAANLINKTTVPGYSDLNAAWYDGNDRCIGAFYINSSGNVQVFYHNRDFFHFDSQLTVYALAYPGTSWGTQVTARAPEFCRQAEFTFDTTPNRASRYYVYYRQGSSTGSGHLVSEARNTGSGDNAETKKINTRRVALDSNLQIDIKVSLASSYSQVQIWQSGWYLPYGF